jgi:hypothetical protein
MPSTDRKLEVKAKTSMAQTASQAVVYAKGLTEPQHSPIAVQEIYSRLEYTAVTSPRHEGVWGGGV